MLMSIDLFDVELLAPRRGTLGVVLLEGSIRAVWDLADEVLETVPRPTPRSMADLFLRAVALFSTVMLPRFERRARRRQVFQFSMLRSRAVTRHSADLVKAIFQM